MDHEQDTPPVWVDPIVAEVRAAREQLLAGAHYDLHELCEQLRAWQEAEGRTVVRRAPRHAYDAGDAA